MHNINFIRENSVIFDNAMKQRGENSISKKIIEIDEEKRKTQTILQTLLAERNSLSKEIGLLKSQKELAEEKVQNEEALQLEGIRELNLDLDILRRLDLKEVNSLYKEEFQSLDLETLIEKSM